jgi:hypothetical protein
VRVARTLLLTSLLLAAAGGLSSISCKSAEQPESKPYFDRTILPILSGSCSQQTTGCHRADSRGNAVGNLDTTSFEMLDRRRDLLVTYGPYGAPGLLTKVSGPQSLQVSTLDGNIPVTTDIRHAAGSGIDPTSDGYATLRRWLDSGATRNNVGPAAPSFAAAGSCKTVVPTAPGFDPAAEIPTLGVFVSKVQPVLKKSCSAGSCHGNDVADLSLTCGDTPEQQKWNAWIASQFVSATPEASEIVRRPLNPSRGGVYHEGGVVFDSTDDDGYKAILEWAKQAGAPKIDASDEGFRYFANRVQPTMVRKGCMFLGCHSPSMFHDLRLSGGSGGQFSIAATRRNYELSKLMLATEAPDPNVSRLIKKNLHPYDRDIEKTAIGTRHRGGALLEDIPRADPLDSSPPKLEECKSFDLEKGDLNKIPGWCTFAHWHEVERKVAIARGGVDSEPIRGLLWIERAPNTDVPQAFDTFRGGAALQLASATMDPVTGIVTAGTTEDLSAKCGLAGADIRGPAVSWDGKKLAFAARASAATPLTIYTANADGTACAKHDKISAHDAQGNGILIHDFDPAWAPDGRLVFASTRGAIGQSDVDYTGPTRTPASLLPNSNLYVVESDGSIRQLTFLLNAELAPSFMIDGRLMYSAEKRAPGFYQLAGRRQNLDGGDYHPLYAQRKSIGFEQLTEIAELADRNFVGVFSDKGALGGAGAIGVINRSLGPDQENRDPADRFYLKSLHLPDAAANGKKGSGGAYRSPSPLPTHGFLASYASGDPYAFDGGFDLVQVDPRDGGRKVLVPRGAGRSVVEAVAIYARPNHSVFTSRLDEVNGATFLEAGKRDAVANILDLPMLASLLFENTREGRNVDRKLRALGLLESLPPPATATSFDALEAGFVGSDEYGKLWVKRRRLFIEPAHDDGSLAVRIPGGMPFVLELYQGKDGTVIATQKEEMQLLPGERARIAFRGPLFDAQCGGCHGSISGREVDVHLTPDVLTAASRVVSIEKRPTDWFLGPDRRGTPTGPPAK